MTQLYKIKANLFHPKIFGNHPLIVHEMTVKQSEIDQGHEFLCRKAAQEIADSQYIDIEPPVPIKRVGTVRKF